MSTPFDPYRKWLGISPKDQPPNYYRLLSVEVFEDDLDVIEGSADRLMGFVRQYQSGEHAALAARILNELSTARLCLLKSSTKAAYDAKLRKELNATQPDSMSAFAEMELDTLERTQRTARVGKRKSPAKSPASPPWQLIGAGIGVAVCVVLAVILFSHGRDPAKGPIKPAEQVTKGDAATSEPILKSNSSPEEKGQTGSASASSSNADTGSTMQTGTHVAAITNYGEWTDLLAWAEGTDWEGTGFNWNKYLAEPPTRSQIRLKIAEAAHFPLPAIIDGNYEMEFEFTRYEGNGDVAFHFPIGIHNVRVLMGAGGGLWSQADFIDGKTTSDVIRRPAPISNHEPHRVVVRAQREGDQASFRIDFDSMENYLQWEGAYSSLTDIEPSPWKTTIIRHPWVGSHLNGDVAFQKIRVRMASGTILRDSITSADKELDLKQGVVRLVGEKPLFAEAYDGFSVNQLLLPPPQTEFRWPRITQNFQLCDDYYGAHPPSRVKCPIPAGAKSFSVVGFNNSSGRSKCQIVIDGTQVHESKTANISIIKVNLPADASILEMVGDADGDLSFAHLYWCFPRFHSVTADHVTDSQLDAKPEFPFVVESAQVGDGTFKVKQPIWKNFPPVHFRDAQPCHEFIFAHAPSTAKYSVPDGFFRFTAIGWNAYSQASQFEVWADGKQIYQSPESGLIKIDVPLPRDTKTIELKVDPLGDMTFDHTMWCFPRLHRVPQ